MEEETRNFSDFLTDEDGQYSKARFMSTARALLDEGRRPDRIFRAMLFAAYEASLEHSLDEHYGFLRFAVDEIPAYKKLFEGEIDTASERTEADDD